MRSRLPWMAAVAATILLLLQFNPAVAPAQDVTQPPPATNPWESLRPPFTAAPTNKITGDAVRKGMIAVGVPARAIHISDKAHYLVEQAWWDRFNTNWPGILKAAGFLYKEDQEDCDDFARFYATTACHIFRLHYQDLAHTLVVGEFWYIPDSPPPLAPAEPHAIVVLGFIRNGKFCIQFVEPQTGRPVNLTESERKSCFFVRF